MIRMGFETRRDGVVPVEWDPEGFPRLFQAVSRSPEPSELLSELFTLMSLHASNVLEDAARACPMPGEETAPLFMHRRASVIRKAFE